MTHEPISESFEASIESSSLDRGYAVVDSGFAVRLLTHHARTFEVTTAQTVAGPEKFTRDVPNVGSEALEALDDDGLVKVGTPVKPGTLLVGKVTPRAGGPASSEEKLLRAIFGEAAGELRDTSLRAPAGCFGTVTEARLDPAEGDDLHQATIEVDWTRPLDVGDVLLVSGEPVVVAAIRPLDADLAWSGGSSTATVAKLAMARDVLHARSIGPYSLVSQQPTVGREAFGGQLLERDQVEYLASQAPWALWEMMTIKSDCVTGRMQAYESLVKQENPKVLPPRPEPAPASPLPPVGTGPTSGGMRDIFSFFETPASAAPGEVRALEPEVVTNVVAYLRALGLELSPSAAEVGVSLLGSEQLRESSRGPVLVPEALNYRTKQPVPDGLFCQRIFGPANDYECACGKYKRMKHRGVVCEKCGVEVIDSGVRRKRFGHVDLGVPCVHPLMVGEVATLLGLTEFEVRGVVRGTHRLLGEGLDWRTEQEQSAFGGRALWDALEGLDLEAIDALEAGPRADLAETLADADRPATDLMLQVVPVLPPDLRPMVAVEGGFATSDLNDLYRRLINRNNRLKRLLELKAPEVIVINECRQLQESVDRLMGGERVGAGLEDEDGRVMRSLPDVIDETFRQRVFTKAVDYSGIAHLVADPSLASDECRVPQSMLVELFKPQAYGILEGRGYTITIKSAKRMIELGRPEGLAAIEEASEGYPVLLMAGPTVVMRRVRAWDEPAIAVDPETARRLASRTTTLHVPLMHEAARQTLLVDYGFNTSARTSDGWLCRARRDQDLVGAAFAAALSNDRDLVDDPVVALALGRIPEELDPEELEDWARQQQSRRASIWERQQADQPAPGLEPSAPRHPHLDRSLDELELSVRTANALQNAGLQTIGELCRRTEAELLKTKNFGRRSLKEIKEILAEMGLSLGMRDG